MTFTTTAISQKLADALTDKFKDQGQTYHVRQGRKFDKIVMTSLNGSSGSVYAFVERVNGNLIKAASWKAPQKNSDGSFAVRYQMDSQEHFDNTVKAADWAGGFLYAR